VAHRALSDSDFFDILVDGGATASISKCLADFIKPPTTTNIRIKGFNGTYIAARIATIRWPISDDEGVRHVLQIRDTYFVASCPKRLLSPQHYSQQTHDHRGTYSTNFGDQVVFVFHKKKFQVTIPLSPFSNVGTFFAVLLATKSSLPLLKMPNHPMSLPLPFLPTLSSLMMKRMIWSYRRKTSPYLPTRMQTMSF
jgi:hypothetical protein